MPVTQEAFVLPEANGPNLSAWNDKTADLAFRENKKKHLNPLMKEHGFLQYNGNRYVRMGKNRIVQTVELQKMSYGKACTINVSFFRLDLPTCDYIPYTRISTLLFVAGKSDRTDFWWSFTEENAEKSFVNMADAIRLFVFPWFEKYEEPVRYRAMIRSGRTEEMACVSEKLAKRFPGDRRKADTEDTDAAMKRLALYDPDSIDAPIIRQYLQNRIQFMNPTQQREKNACQRILDRIDQGIDVETYRRAWIEANMEIFRFPKGLLKQIAI